MAIRIHASVVSGKASKSLLNRRERLSQPKVRSTIQRHCRTWNPWVDNSSARLPIAAMCFPHIAAQSVVYPVPCPQEPPASKVIVDRLMRRKVLRQQAPLATATQDVEDSIWTTLCWTWPLGTRNACGSAKPADKRENPLH